ncbi:MAG: GGDEF domain-containing protein [Lachnospiraceae bacterium]
MKETTDSGLLFEYYPDKDKMVFVYNLPNNKKRREIEHYQKYLAEFPMVHSAHLTQFKEILGNCCRQEAEGELEYLSTVSGGGYRWHITHYQSFADSSGKIVSVKGSICDIHDKKMESQQVPCGVDRDKLTDIYDRKSAFWQMEEYVKEAPFAKFYFIVLNLDQLTEINDQYGQEYGDKVIKGVAALLERTFGEDSIVGRAEGDEFIILTKNVSRAEINRKLGQVQEETKFCAGIVEWKYGDKIERVFEKAKKVMQQAKKRGGNGICFY